jgi:hypothetical protein
MNQKKAALCIRGAISKSSGRFLYAGDVYNDSTKYIKYTSAYKSIHKHIIQANPEYDVDVFIHCWNEDLQEDIISLYNPVKYLFENNNKYTDEINSLCSNPWDFGGISHSLSIKKVLELQEEYSSANNIQYDIVVLFRPDVLIWKDMIFSKYDLNYFYVDGHGGYHGEFYFIMSQARASVFKNLYLSATYNKYAVHFWIKNYVLNYCNFPMKDDDIVPGKHIEVFRKIREYSLNSGHINYENLRLYDIFPEDI